MTLFVDDADFRLYVGDVRDCLRELPDESVHCVVTSPPYWGLRDYGTGSWVGGNPDCDHKNDTEHQRQGATSVVSTSPAEARRNENFRDVCGKCGATRVDQQIGLEATPELFVASMVEVFREVRRVLRADGTCWVNLGDSYMARQFGWGTSDDRSWAAYHREAGDERPKAERTGHSMEGSNAMARATGLKPKDLVGIPWRVAFALQADGWYLRSDIVWSKPNPMPESVTDRPTKAHEMVFLLTKSPRYFFDQEAVREANEHPDRTGTNPRLSYVTQPGNTFQGRNGRSIDSNPTGRNIRSVWEIATQPYPEAHFATFPEALPERCIRAGTSERGCCPECGAPWERETVQRPMSEVCVTSNGAKRQGREAQGLQSAVSGLSPSRVKGMPVGPEVTTIGWRPSCRCAHETYRDSEGHEWPEIPWPPVPCTVLDPFMGSGTTAHVARRLGRRSIGIELNESYAALCARRLQQLSLFAGDAS